MDEFPTDLPLPARPLSTDVDLPAALPLGLGTLAGGGGGRRPLSAQSRTSSNSTTVTGSRQVSKLKRRSSRGKNGLGRANSMLSEASDVAAEQRYKRSLSRPCSAVSAEILARRNGLGTPSTEAETVTYMDPPLMHPRSVTPSAASMHESALHAGTKYKMPFSQARHLTARRLYQDSNHVGMARFNVQLPKTPNHRKLCVPAQPEGTRPRTNFPRGEAFGPRNLRRMFKNIDTDHSGSIDGLELIEVLRQDPSLIRLFKKLQGDSSFEDSSSIRNLTDRDKVYVIKSLLHTGDADGNGTMEWPEFLEFFQRSRLYLEWKSRPDLNELSSEDGDGSEESSGGEFGSGDEAEGAKRPISPAQMGRRFSAATSAIFFNDPRSMNRRLAVSTFLRGGALSWQAKDSPWACLGNDWNAEQDRFEIEIGAKDHTTTKHRCHNGEAAFVSLMFPESAADVCGLAGPEARLRGRILQDAAEVRREQENRNRPFYMSEKPIEVTTWGPKEAWHAMASVLRAKFAAGSECATALESTGESFLLHRGDQEESEHEPLWSDRGDGTGLNGLGLQLMVLRDELLGRDHWSSFLSDLFDFLTGEPKTADALEYWQSIVRTAGLSIAQHQRAVVRRASRSSGAGSAEVPQQDAAALRAALRKEKKAAMARELGTSGLGSKFVGVGRLRPIRATIANVVELATAAAAAARAQQQAEAAKAAQDGEVGGGGGGEERLSPANSSRKAGKLFSRKSTNLTNMDASMSRRSSDGKVGGGEKRLVLLPGLKAQGHSATLVGAQAEGTNG
mmetsp:Transcript_44445/g.95844  ORF Transcript_44445/g.95844 Transcript_44445/m.95844 type:complete len:788 (-) Transcript_44445:68-2431(-)